MSLFFPPIAQTGWIPQKTDAQPKRKMAGFSAYIFFTLHHQKMDFICGESLIFWCTHLPLNRHGQTALRMPFFVFPQTEYRTPSNSVEVPCVRQRQTFHETSWINIFFSLCHPSAGAMQIFSIYIVPILLDLSKDTKQINHSKIDQYNRLQSIIWFFFLERSIIW